MGSNVVILKRLDYIAKMVMIFNDSPTFKRVGPASTCDNTSKTKTRTQMVAFSVQEQPNLHGCL